MSGDDAPTIPPITIAMNVFQSNAAFTPSNPLYPPYVVLPPSLMPGGDILTLWCVVYGNSVPFQIFVHSDVNVAHLQEEIKRNRAFTGFPSSSLLLWKVGLHLWDLFYLTLSCQLHDAEPVDPAHTLAERIRLRGGDVEIFAKELTIPTQKMSTLFPQSHPPLEDHVHFLVQLPSSEPIVIIFYAFTTTTTSHRRHQILAGCNSY